MIEKEEFHVIIFVHVDDLVFLSYTEDKGKPVKEEPGSQSQVTDLGVKRCYFDILFKK